MNIYIYIIIIISIRCGFNNLIRIIEAELNETINLNILTIPKNFNYNFNNTFLQK